MPKAPSKSRSNKSRSKKRPVSLKAAMAWGRKFEALAKFGPSPRAQLVHDVWAMAKNRDLAFRDMVWVTAELLWQVHIHGEVPVKDLIALQTNIIRLHEPVAPDFKDTGDEVLQPEVHQRSPNTASIRSNP